MTLNSGADVVVIGGGVVGLAVARRLRKDGAAVSLLERGAVGGEASWAGAGIVSPCNPHRDDLVYHLTERSLRQYASFCAELLDETGIDPEYDHTGLIEILLTEQSVSMARSDVRAASRQRTVDGKAVLEWLSPEETWASEEAVTRDMLGATLCRKSASVRNPRLLQALAASCARAGVRIHQQSEVVGLCVESGRVVGVRLKDAALCAKHVIVCAGAWSSTIDARLSALMPVHPVRGQMVLMKLERRPFQHIISRGKTYLVPRRDSHVLLGSTEEPEAGFRKRCTPRGIGSLMESGVRLVPSLSEAPVEAVWSGLRPGTPDDKPYLGFVPGFEGLMAATGHFRAGLTLAPVTAEIVSTFLRGREYDLDLSGCAPGRHRETGGSELHPYTTHRSS